jgi:hypothetical protein
VNKSFVIILSEWKEIMEIKAVKEVWALEGVTREDFASQVYGLILVGELLLN